MFRSIFSQDKPLRLKDFSEEEQMTIIQSCCEYFPEIAETSLDQLIQVLYDLDLREAIGLGEDAPDS